MRSPPLSWRDLGRIAAFAAVYFIAARIGISLKGSVFALVWPPAGLALATLWLFGFRLWPGILIGDILANVLIPGISPLSVAVFAVGNTLEMVIGVYLVRRLSFDNTLQRVNDVYRLLLAAVISAAVSATITISMLRAGGVIAAGGFGSSWFAWWLADIMSVLLIASFLLSWGARPRRRIQLRQAVEFVLLMTLMVTITLCVFHATPLAAIAGFPQPCVLFPLVVWAALRFGPRGATTANLVLSVISIWATTVNGSGPFVHATLSASLFDLQTFMVITSLTSLFMGAAIAERNWAIGVREEFMAIASHELKTPLTPLKLNLQYLRQWSRRGAPGGILPDKIDRRFASSEQQVDRLSSLMTDLLDVTSICSGRSAQLTLDLASIDLAQTVRQVVESFREQLALSRCEVDLSVDTPVVGTWDRLRLQQVIANLLTNAMKFGKGKPISISVVPQDSWALLLVQDRGIGIEKEAQARIFERFARASAARHFPGMGLGLYITRQIVDAHGGYIQVTSAPGDGATFMVAFPREPPHGQITC
jgi:signal transduction histidine kinase